MTVLWFEEQKEISAGIKELYKQIENMHNGKLPTELTKSDALIDVDIFTII